MRIERYHRPMKNVVKLEHYYYPWELEKAIEDWVHHYNHERCLESLDNVTPAVVRRIAAPSQDAVVPGEVDSWLRYERSRFCF